MTPTLRTSVARAAVVIAALSLGVSACNEEPRPAPQAAPTPTRTPVNNPAKLTFGVWGNQAEIDAYQQVVGDYNSRTDLADVTLESWSSDAAMMQAIHGGQVPDVFLVSRADLAQLWAEERVEPVDSYLDARAVDIGDEYSRDALEAFSADHRLQCMPYAVSPRVIYYNTDLVDFPRMKATGLQVPTAADNKSWSLEDFATAATFATTARNGARGFAIDPSVSGLAPFIYSAGGRLVNDDGTSLAFSDGDTRAALENVLGTLRNAQLTLTPQQLDKQPALTWFEQGRLGMIAGDRSLVPRLRAVRGLHWDVLPMPTVDQAATVGDFTGLCLAKDAKRLEDAADLLVALSSDAMVKTVASTGYVVPVNQQVALSPDFLQPLLQPLHAGVFVNSVRSMQILPHTAEWPALESAVSAPLRQLLQGGPTLDLDAVTQRIDELSQPVLAPPSSTASPSASPSG